MICCSVIGDLRKSSLPDAIRDTSRRSSISRTMWLTWRSIIARVRSRSSAFREVLRICNPLRIGASGLRSSCARVARNSVFMPIGSREPLVQLAGCVACLDQLALVLVPVADDDQRELLVVNPCVEAAGRIEQHRQPPSVAMHHLDLDLGDRALHLQQRSPVRLLENATAHRQQPCVKRRLPTRSAQSCPIQWQNVALTDSIVPSTAVTSRPQGAASSNASAGNSRIVRSRYRARNLSIASALAPGELRCGQWPTFSMTTSSLPGIVRFMYSPTDSGAMMSSLHCRISDGIGDLRQVRPVVGQERHAREVLGDVGVGRAEAVGELLAELRLVGRAHDRRRHRARPSEVVAVERVEQAVDVPRVKPPT